jgi:hypothetical protein
MGIDLNNFQEMVIDSNAKKSFLDLVDFNKDKYGYGRNGTISTTSLDSEPKMSFKKYTVSNEKKAQEFIKKEFKNDNIDIRQCCFIDLGVVHYKIITVTQKSIKNSPKFKKMYVVYYDNNKKFFESKKDAENFALKYKLEHIHNDVNICHEYVPENGDAKIAEYTYEITTKKSMTKPLKELPNRKVVEMHKYIFYGVAVYSPD